MKAKLRKQLAKRKRQLAKRLNHQAFDGIGIHCPDIKYELAEKSQAISCGGLGAIMQVVKQLDLRKTINQSASVFKLQAPYSEADHILNIAFNLLAGGTCLEHIETRRNDEAYLEALGTRRIPAPRQPVTFADASMP